MMAAKHKTHTFTEINLRFVHDIVFPRRHQMHCLRVLPLNHIEAVVITFCVCDCPENIIKFLVSDDRASTSEPVVSEDMVNMCFRIYQIADGASFQCKFPHIK